MLYSEVNCQECEEAKWLAAIWTDNFWPSCKQFLLQLTSNYHIKFLLCEYTHYIVSMQTIRSTLTVLAKKKGKSQVYPKYSKLNISSVIVEILILRLKNWHKNCACKYCTETSYVASLTCIYNTLSNSTSQSCSFNLIHLDVSPIDFAICSNKVQLWWRQHLWQTDGGNGVIVRHSQVHTPDLIGSGEQ